MDLTKLNALRVNEAPFVYAGAEAGGALRSAQIRHPQALWQAQCNVHVGALVPHCEDLCSKRPCNEGGQA
jgi:hypothetical protein